MGASRKIFGTSYLFLQPLKLATSNFGTQVGFGELRAKKQHLGPKLAWVGTRGTSQKFWDPLFISATIKGSNFKFGTQRGFDRGVRYNNSFSTKLGRSWLVYMSTSKIVWTRYHVPYHVTAAEM